MTPIIQIAPAGQILAAHHLEVIRGQLRQFSLELCHGFFAGVRHSTHWTHSDVVRVCIARRSRDVQRVRRQSPSFLSRELDSAGLANHALQRTRRLRLRLFHSVTGFRSRPVADPGRSVTRSVDGRGPDCISATGLQFGRTDTAIRPALSHLGIVQRLQRRGPARDMIPSPNQSLLPTCLGLLLSTL